MTELNRKFVFDTKLGLGEIGRSDLRGTTSMQTIHPDVVLAALSHVEGDAFERFFKEFGSDVFGLSFVPLGGKKDGGADGFSNPGLFESNREGTYFQASVQENYKQKLSDTLLRLKEYGRDVSNVTLFTSRLVKDVDLVEIDLSKKHNVSVTIRDGQWISNRINQSQLSQSAFENHLSVYLRMSESSYSNVKAVFANEFNVNAAVFLSQEALLPGARKDLRGSIIDSLILYALEEEASGAGGFLSLADIEVRAKSYFPRGYDIEPSEMYERIGLLATREHPLGKQITYDSRYSGYILPFEERNALKERHAKFEALLFKVREHVRDVALELLPDATKDDLSRLSEYFTAALEGIYRSEGLKVAQFLDAGDEDIEEKTVSDNILAVLKDRHSPPSKVEEYHSILKEAMRRIFYAATGDQLEYLGYLARSYSLFFSLKYDVKLSRYFKDLKSNFRLVIGSDIVIQALSESRLKEKDRSTHNMLKIARASGAELILTDYAVEEAYTHIYSTDQEYINNYQDQDQYITIDVAAQIDRVLIRSYYYAKLRPAEEGRRIRSWGAFLEQFLPYTEMGSGEGKMAFRSYLRDKFGLRLALQDDVADMIDNKDKMNVSSKLLSLGIKNKRVLAENDASHVLYAYALRDESNEIAVGSSVGYRTWWLTQETRVQKVLADLVSRKGKVIMRPEVLMNLISFSPSADEIESSFGTYFPSILGVKLGNRVSPDLLKYLIREAERVSKADPARMRAEIERLSNRIKSDEASKRRRAFEPVELL